MRRDSRDVRANDGDTADISVFDQQKLKRADDRLETIKGLYGSVIL